MARGGGYCLKCGKANYAVERDNLKNGQAYKEQDQAAIERFHYCGWCGADLEGAVVKVLPDNVEAKRAVDGKSATG